MILCLAACLQTITLLGPMFGFLLGSYCAKLYVDIGYVDMGKFSAFVLEDACIISYICEQAATVSVMRSSAEMIQLELMMCPWF